MKIRVDRDSVCMGDDVLPHETEFDVPEDMTVKDFFVFQKGNVICRLFKEIMWPGNSAIEMGNKVFISLKQERLSIQMEY